MTPELKKKIGQMLSAGFPSPQVDEQAIALARDYAVGNYYLFSRNIISAKQTCDLCEALSSLAYEYNGGICDLSALYELHFLPYGYAAGYLGHHRLVPYLQVGVGLTYGTPGKAFTVNSAVDKHTVFDQIGLGCRNALLF